MVETRRAWDVTADELAAVLVRREFELHADWQRSEELGAELLAELEPTQEG